MNNFDQLSRGCQLCQQGKWLCIFLTYNCNANCNFCPAPFKDDHISSAFGNQKEEILSFLGKTDFEGISFSGGDPFLVFEKLFEWFTYFKKHLPDYYYWAYTNGIAVTEKRLQLLSAEGLDEIRFNIAATGYLNENIWEIIRIAGKLFPFVSIEIPSINRDFELLAKALERIDRNGVDYLNLHDYILQERDFEQINEQSETFLLNKVIPIKFAGSSIRNTYKIIELTLKKGYNFQVNHCSMQQKELQMSQRRLQMGKIFNDPEYDMELPDGTFCNFYSIPENLKRIDLQRNFSNPDFRKTVIQYLSKLDDPQIHGTTGEIVKVFYIPRMGIDQDKIFIKAEVQQV